MKLRWTAAGPAFVAIYFLLLTGHAVYTYFTPDDFLNLYQAWSKPAGEIARANLLFFLPTDLARPLGSAWYRLMYAMVGLHPAPYKIVNLALLVANIVLTYALARRLAKSRTAGTLAALLCCYHPEALDLYFNTGFIADVLCYFFYFSAALLYVRARQEDRFPTWRELAAICALYVCAINSKELAVTLPVFLLLYEVIYHRTTTVRKKGTDCSVPARRVFAPPSTLAVDRVVCPPFPSPSERPTDWRETLPQMTAILATGAITLAWLIGKMSAPISLLNDNAMYRPSLTWRQFMLTSTNFTGHLFLRPDSLKPAMLLALWSAMLLIAWRARSRALWLAWWFLMLSPLPVAFIPPRAVAQYYIPLFGWVLYAGALLDRILAFLFRYPHDASAERRHRAFRNRTLAGAALVILIAAIAYRPWRAAQVRQPDTIVIEAEMNRSVVTQLHRLNPVLPHGARLMFLDDPIDAHRWNMTFMVHLGYNDASIVIDRMKAIETGTNTTANPGVKNPDLASYDHVFDYRGGHFMELTPPWRRAAAPAVVIERGRPQMFNPDGTEITRDHPARPGDVLFLKAMDLGATDPPVPAGEPFPDEPFAQATGNIEARINGAPAAVELRIGWPGTTFYRLDVRVPPGTAKGSAWIEITANGRSGPATEFPAK